MTEKRKSSTR